MLVSPQKFPSTVIPVMLIGDHPWSGHQGVIESLPGGNFSVLNVLGVDMLLVTLSNGHECYAKLSDMREVKRSTPPNQT